MWTSTHRAAWTWKLARPMRRRAKVLLAPRAEMRHSRQVCVVCDILREYGLCGLPLLAFT
jgi:hypothetical protein